MTRPLGVARYATTETLVERVPEELGDQLPALEEIYIAQQTHLLALGDPKRAAEMVAQAERAANNESSASSAA
jgi:hypothetical protein